ncbi:patatin-like phospholipase family protein [Bradyrhizobium diazoefficiens]|uniref:patatin-like phospholipase family protein n=1 Tax=Bradyrhizobium diazoefficiens TaxID=1355477 RepID=UPI00190DEFBD|nr:patatin-like phospholipase family protein [Bradyrhizobium diazoefficiens]MBK3660373.1 patatin-like phospholipase family protein [Bradyrhizobium diazoefficiens]
MEEAISPKIGLALSGGGSRAMAFHLGCLRALDRLGLLHRIDVLSTVSGGSVIGVYFHAYDGDFASFEAKMREILSRGLAKRMCRKLFGPLGLKVAAAFALIGIVAVIVALIRTMVGLLKLVMPESLARHFESFDVRSPLHRFASRTSLLEAVLDELLFGGASMSDLRPKPRLVINATELRTGSAFRFGTKESGSWRWGKLHRNDVSVAHAVAASAAYPLFLPAFDETFTFDHKGTRAERVVLTDGGIYDNLGLGCLWPDRSPDVSLNVTPVDTIICCSAGYGLRQEPPSQFMLARMSSVFGALFDRAQNASIHRLHEAQRSGQIKHFIFPYLGQLDKTLPDPPSDLVRREEAHLYPTDFNAMPTEWIDRLSIRGEQLTLCLARAYIPHLIEKPAIR